MIAGASINILIRKLNAAPIPLELLFVNRDCPGLDPMDTAPLKARNGQVVGTTSRAHDIEKMITLGRDYS